MTAPSSKKLPGRLSIPATLEMSMLFNSFKTISSVVGFIWNLVVMLHPVPHGGGGGGRSPPPPAMLKFFKNVCNGGMGHFWYNWWGAKFCNWEWEIFRFSLAFPS